MLVRKSIVGSFAGACLLVAANPALSQAATKTPVDIIAHPSGAKCTITNLQNVHPTKNSSGRVIMHGKMNITCNAVVKLHIVGTVSGGNLHGGAGPVPALQTTSEEFLTAPSYKYTVYIPSRETSTVACHVGWSYKYDAKVWAVSALGTTNTALVGTNLQRATKCNL